MRKIYEIFKTESRVVKKEKPKEKIIIDYREKNCTVASELIKEGFEIEFKELKVGDYIAKDVVIERKTVSDFISSMINKRLLSQLKDLQQIENKILIIEGIEEQELYPEGNCINPNAIRGFILSIILKYKVPIIMTQNQRDTAKFISVISRKKEKETSLKIKKRAKNKKEQIQMIIESFPGIGPKISKKLMKEFKSIKNLINASEEELEKIIGKKAKIFRELIDEI